MRHQAGMVLLAALVVSGFSRPDSVVSALRRTMATSVWSGVYTAEQAASGEKIYYSRCSTCHGDDLAGVERAPALAGPQFLDAWDKKDLRRLLDRVMTMPPGDPKTLTAAEAADVVAFLLRSSEMPSGSTALPADRVKLVEITFERTKP